MRPDDFVKAIDALASGRVLARHSEWQAWSPPNSPADLRRLTGP